MLFDYLSINECVAAGVIALLFVLQVYWYSRYLAAPARKMRKDKRTPISNLQSSSETPAVSVILCAHNEGYNLSAYLPALLSQDYPAYEVIVVNDGSEDNTQDVVKQFMVSDPRLHMTFVPANARVRSTKKLALTLGAKAAQYDYLLLTDADCVPESNQWIRSMMAGFREEQKEIVLGFGAYFPEEGHVNRLVRYDTLFNGLHYLGAAICGHPYMGVGRNLAYRKALFFETGGFSHLMQTRAGDDDLFVNHTATKQNTAVVVNRESYTWSPAKKTLRDWLQQKRRHLSVSPQYRTTTKWRLLYEPLTRGLFYAAVIAVIVWTMTNLQLPIVNNQIPFLLLIAVGLFLLRWLLQTAIINVSARRMGLPRFSIFTILWMDIILPLVNLWMLIIPQRQNNKW